MNFSLSKICIGVIFSIFCLGCGESEQGYYVSEGELCGTTRYTHPRDPNQGRWDPDKVTVTTRTCEAGLVCLNTKCVEACPANMEYECEEGVCECVNIFPKLGESCDKRQCASGLLCALIRDEVPTQICVTTAELYCENESDCESRICRPNGLCADRKVGEPCQSTPQCESGECRLNSKEERMFCG